MSEKQTKPKAFRRRVAVVGGLMLCFGAGVAFQFALSRWGPSHPQIKTVRSDASNSWAFMSGGTWPPSRYPVEAFEGMQTEVKEILESVIGSDEALGRYVYVLPAFSGYDIIMHEPSDKRSMTDKELDEFSARIRKRMNELGIQYARPGDEKAKTGSLPP